MAERHFSELSDDSAQEFLRVALPHYNPTPADPDVIARTRLKLEVGNAWFRTRVSRPTSFPSCRRSPARRSCSAASSTPSRPSPTRGHRRRDPAGGGAHLRGRRPRRLPRPAREGDRRHPRVRPAMSDLLEYRDRFPILEHTTYLINHSLGAMPAAVEERVAEYARTWAERGIRAWGEGWWTMPLDVGDQIGRIVGAPPGTVCMHQNVSIAEVDRPLVLSAAGERNRIVYERENFPWCATSTRRAPPRGRRRRTTSRGDRRADAARPGAARPVQVGRDPGRRGDRRRAHAAGAYVVLDAYQSAGWCRST